MKTSRSFGGYFDLRKIVGGILVHPFYTLNDDAAWVLWNSGGFWCPLVLGTQQRRAAASKGTPVLGVLSAQGLGTTMCQRPRGSPFALPGAEEGQPVWGTRRVAQAPDRADFGARAWLPYVATGEEIKGSRNTSGRCVMRRR